MGGRGATEVALRTLGYVPSKRNDSQNFEISGLGLGSLFIEYSCFGKGSRDFSLFAFQRLEIGSSFLLPVKQISFCLGK